MCEGSLVGISNQDGSWDIGSLISFLRSGKFRPTMYGRQGAQGGGSGGAFVHFSYMRIGSIR